MHTYEQRVQEQQRHLAKRLFGAGRRLLQCCQSPQNAEDNRLAESGAAGVIRTRVKRIDIAAESAEKRHVRWRDAELAHEFTEPLR